MAATFSFPAAADPSLYRKSEARQQNETDAEPISKPSSGRNIDGDTEFKQQQSKQAEAAKDHGAASLASEKEKLQKVCACYQIKYRLALL